MPHGNGVKMPENPQFSAFKIALLYTIIGALWILFSDQLIKSLYIDRDILFPLQTYKGWFFVVVTAALLYLWNCREFKRIKHIYIKLIEKKQIHQKELLEASIKIDDSEKKYRSLYNSIRDAILVADTERKIIHCNQAFFDLFGYTLDDIQGKPTAYVYESEDEFEKMGQKIKDNVGNKNFLYVVKYKKKSGEVFAGETSVFHLYNETGKVSGFIGMIRDVTERLQAEAKLRKSQRQLSNLMSNLPGMAYRCKNDNEWTMEFTSEGAKELTGYLPDELIFNATISYDQIIYPEDRHLVRKVVEQAIPQNRPFELEYRILTKSGDIKWVWEQGQVVPHNDGEAETLEGIVLDITKRKATERELRESEQKFNAFMTYLPGFVYLKDENGRHIYMNRLLLELLGIKETEYLGKTNKELLPGRDIDAIDENDRKILKTGEPAQFEEQIEDDGELKTYLSTKFPVRLENKGIFLGGISLDITERKLAQLELQRTKNLLETIYNNLTEAVFVIHPEERKITSCNKAVETIYGYKREELIDKSSEILHLDKSHFKKFVNRAKPVLDKNGIFQFETETKRKDGKIIHIEHTVSTIESEQGWRRGVLSVIRDITKQKQFIKELKESQEQLRSLAGHLQQIREHEREAIARDMHDDLGQLLTSLKMDLTILEREFARDKSPDQTDIVNEIKKMKELIDITITKVRQLIRELRPEVLDNLGLLDAIEWQIEEFMSRTGIKCNIRKGVKDIQLDKEKEIAIFRIVQEALTNVARHAHADKVTINIRKKNHDIHISIKDNGIGIDEEKLRKEQTFGLLGIKERAFIVGGEVKVSGVKNRGTTLTVNIPLN